MSESVLSIRVPEALKQEFYRAIGEKQAQVGRKVEIKEVGQLALAMAIKYLRGELPASCIEAANEVLEELGIENEATVRG